MLFMFYCLGFLIKYFRVQREIAELGLFAESDSCITNVTASTFNSQLGYCDKWAVNVNATHKVKCSYIAQRNLLISFIIKLKTHLKCDEALLFI